MDPGHRDGIHIIHHVHHGHHGSWTRTATEMEYTLYIMYMECGVWSVQVMCDRCLCALPQLSWDWSDRGWSETEEDEQTFA